eukprot:CAMPEP_0170519478 /NCGR_PEP_ID=MMETSP0209-20121228/4878_1 /TAXON_ID=665100 ORGANISM="Litonotus pictus, Strain P1" /NCGR_SAMPLE_ID=MMETSP0209 /ASSEMBLY_ACC=CAM_ASM_000301 /LENGTH=459 /DNA_ID=CAMNT_0010805373 /DNA_START=407 /DNA_END=1786 /DNA_ORIENTATION=+
MRTKLFKDNNEDSYYGTGNQKTSYKKISKHETANKLDIVMINKEKIDDNKSPKYSQDMNFGAPMRSASSLIGFSDKKGSGQPFDYFPDKSPIRPSKNKPNPFGKNTLPISENINTTLLNIVNEMNDPNNMNTFTHQTDHGASIYLPLNTQDIDEELRLAEAGYLEEDDEDLKSSGMSGGFFGLDDEEKYTFKLGKEEEEDKSKDKIEKSVDYNLISDKKLFLNTKEELEAILFPKSQFEINQNQTFFVKTVILDNGVEVVEENLLVIVLNYLYLELHNGLIELGDNLLEERRKYFHKNFDTYLSIVNFFLKSKEEFFLGVLSQLMSKLSISQTLLDSSFNYYMNEAEETEKVLEIKIAYEKVYRAGEKYSIAPKIITKLRLKNILQFQLESCQELMQKYPDLNNDVLEIIVTDTTYSEYGFDREAIRAAIQKHEIYNDHSFEEIINKLDEFKNSSFLNI